jgi:hypothetical protein
MPATSRGRAGPCCCGVLRLPCSHGGSPRHGRRALLGAAFAAALASAPVAPHRVEAQGAPTARVTGEVRADSTGRPVVGAVVSLAGSERSARADTLGRFLLSDVPPGARTLSVRAIGFSAREVPLILEAGDSINVAVRLTAMSPELAAVTVTASTERRSLYFDEFTERRRTHNGRFLDHTQFAQDLHQSLSTILRRFMPGVRIVRYGGGRVAIASSRGVDSFLELPRGDPYDRSLGAPQACYVQVVINDVLVYGSGREESLYNIDLLQPDRIEAAEFYTSATTPPRFNRGATGSCGVLVLWLRP